MEASNKLILVGGRACRREKFRSLSGLKKGGRCSGKPAEKCAGRGRGRWWLDRWWLRRPGAEMEKKMTSVDLNRQADPTNYDKEHILPALNQDSGIFCCQSDPRWSAQIQFRLKCQLSKASRVHFQKDYKRLRSHSFQIIASSRFQ